MTDCDLPQIKHCSIVTQGSTDTSSSSEMHLCESGASLVVHEENSMDSQVNICRSESYNLAVGHSVGRNDIQDKEQTNKPAQIGKKINKTHKVDGKDVVLNMPVLPPLELSIPCYEQRH